MAVRTVKEFSERIIKKINDAKSEKKPILTGKKPLTPIEDFEKKCNDLVIDIGERIKEGESSPQKRRVLSESLISVSNSGPNGSDWIGMLAELKDDYRTSYYAFERLYDTATVEHHIHVKAQRIALFYRVLTTLGIGGSIMIIYWIAHYFGIPMPMMRLPTS